MFYSRNYRIKRVDIMRMRNIFIAACLALLIAAPLAAGWRTDATYLTWFIQKPTADMTQLRDALNWYSARNALSGMLGTAVRPSVVLTDVGGGNSELAINMPLATGNAWVDAYAPTICSVVSTVEERQACVEAGVKADLNVIWLNYRIYLNAQANPVATPAPL